MSWEAEEGRVWSERVEGVNPSCNSPSWRGFRPIHWQVTFVCFQLQMFANVIHSIHIHMYIRIYWEQLQRNEKINYIFTRFSFQHKYLFMTIGEIVWSSYVSWICQVVRWTRSLMMNLFGYFPRSATILPVMIMWKYQNTILQSFVKYKKDRTDLNLPPSIRCHLPPPPHPHPSPHLSPFPRPPTSDNVQ